MIRAEALILRNPFIKKLIDGFLIEWRSFFLIGFFFIRDFPKHLQFI